MIEFCDGSVSVPFPDVELFAPFDAVVFDSVAAVVVRLNQGGRSENKSWSVVVDGVDVVVMFISGWDVTCVVTLAEESGIVEGELVVLSSNRLSPFGSSVLVSLVKLVVDDG